MRVALSCHGAILLGKIGYKQINQQEKEQMMHVVLYFCKGDLI